MAEICHFNARKYILITKQNQTGSYMRVRVELWHFNQKFGFEILNWYYKKILYQTVITKESTTEIPTTKTGLQKVLSLASWTLHKGGLQGTVVNKYCTYLYKDQSQISLFFWESTT